MDKSAAYSNKFADLFLALDGAWEIKNAGGVRFICLTSNQPCVEHIELLCQQQQQHLYKCC
jgi:hypothetical protein